MLIDNSINPDADHDVGIASQTMLLGAVERGLGGCMLGSVKRKRLTESLDIPDGYAIPLVIALGTPSGQVVLEDAPSSGSVTYYREPDGSHHVPKRGIDELILKSFT